MPDEALESLARGLRERNLDIGWAVETVLRSEAFFSSANIASKISGPAEFVVGMVRALELLDEPPSTLILADWCARMGQNLFYPPNVGGWNGGRHWLTTRAVITRANFAAALVAGELSAPTREPQLEQLAKKLGRHGSRESTEHLLGKLLLSSTPEKLPRAAAKPPLEAGETLIAMLSRPHAYLN